MAHAPSSGGLAANSLVAPVVTTELGCRVGTLSTGLFLLVESAVSAATADAVGLCVTLTERGCSFGLGG